MIAQEPANSKIVLPQESQTKGGKELQDPKLQCTCQQRKHNDLSVEKSDNVPYDFPGQTVFIIQEMTMRVQLSSQYHLESCALSTLVSYICFSVLYSLDSIYLEVENLT